MKKTALFTILCIIPSFVKAESQAVGGQWRGLHNSDASILIDDNEAQSIQDVDIMFSGSGIKKRGGYSQFRTIGNSTWGVRGGYYYRDTDGTDTIINCNLRSIYYSTNSLAYTAIVTTDTAGSYYDFADSQGYLWRTTNNRDEIVRITSTTATYYPNSPKGNQIEATPTRLVISGTTANPNRLNYSKSGDFTTFTTGPLDTDPFTEDIGLPGQSIQAIKYAFGGILAWTKDSLSLVTAKTQYDLNPTIGISNTLGTDQPYSIVSDLGIVYWQGQDKHFYSFDGSAIHKISTKLDITNIASPALKTWIVTSQSDFGNGTFNVGLSSLTSPGDVTNTPEISQTDSDTCSNLNLASAAQSFYPTQTFIISYAEVSVAPGYPAPSNEVSTWTIRSDNSGVPSTTILSTATVTLRNNGGCGGGGESAFYSLSFSPATSLSANTTYWLYVTTTTNNYSWNFKSGTNPFPRGQQFRTTVSTATDANSDFYFKIMDSSATYQSTAFNIGTAINAWGTFQSLISLSGGTLSFAVYGDTNSSITTSDATTFISSQTITSGSVPTIATAAYATWTALFSRTLSTHTATLNEVVVNWNEGSTTQHFGSVDKDHRILWSVATGTSTVPDTTYIYDKRFDTFLKYSVPLNVAVKVGDSLYFGGVSTGVVYQFPSGNTDNGSAITAFWQSKDFIGSDPYSEKDFGSYSLIAKTQTGSTLDVTYAINTSGSTKNTYSLTDADGNLLHRINTRLPSGKFGTFINFKIGNTSGDAPFEFYTFKYDYKPRPWRVLP